MEEERSSLGKRKRALRLMEETRKYAVGDPLQPWIRFFQCTKETDKELLELCIQRFMHDDRYRSDIRFLRLCIRYADACVNEEEDKFTILEANHIGQTHSLFYEAYAFYMEARRHFHKANKIYQLGLSRHAQPFTKLETAYENFLSRMKQRLNSKKDKKTVLPTTKEKDGYPGKPNTNDGNNLYISSAQFPLHKNICNLNKSSSEIDCPREATKYSDPLTMKQSTEFSSTVSNLNTIEDVPFYNAPLNYGEEKCFEAAKIEVWNERRSTSLCSPSKLLDDMGYLTSSTFNHIPNGDVTYLSSKVTDNNAPRKQLCDKHNREPSFTKIEHLQEKMSTETSGKAGSQSDDCSIISEICNQVQAGVDGGGDKTTALCTEQTIHNKMFAEQHLDVCDLTVSNSRRKGEDLIQDRSSSLGGFKRYAGEDLWADTGCHKWKVACSNAKQDTVLSILENGSFVKHVKRNTSCNEGLPKAGKENINLPSSLTPEQKLHKEPLLIQHSCLENSKVDENAAGILDPWNAVLVNSLLRSLNPPLSHYEGFYPSNKRHSESTNLQNLGRGAHNKILTLGVSKYRLKGCTGKGAFAHVFQARDEDNPESTVVLKIQRPAWPWEFYIYRQLDQRIPTKDRCCFGYASKMYSFRDCSIMVCDYGEHGTLQDVVNSYLATGQRMDEILCMYYSIEMLRMLETLHSVGIIHGDFKPDNLLIRSDSSNLEEWAPDRPGHWKKQGLCLIDWGRSIDMTLFSKEVEFLADCKTSGFRCIEMQEKRHWTYQVDTYGLCCVVHTMLHGSYLEVEADNAGHTERMYHPKCPLKRYWNHDLWKHFFSTLLNIRCCKENPFLNTLREGFENYLMSNSHLTKKLKFLLMKQSNFMFSQK